MKGSSPLIPLERAAASNWIGGWVGHRPGLDTVEYEKNLDTARYQPTTQDILHCQISTYYNSDILHCRITIITADSEFPDNEYLRKYMQSIKSLVWLLPLFHYLQRKMGVMKQWLLQLHLNIYVCVYIYICIYTYIHRNINSGGGSFNYYE